MRSISKRLLSIAFVLFMAAIFISVGTSGTASATDAVKAPTLTTHSPIIIYNESQLVSMAASEGWSGDGSSSNPYSILAYDITASTYCIYIANTVSYVTISYCNLHGASSDGGIVLVNVQHVLIVNNNCNGNYYGIHMYGGSSNNTLSGNTVNENTYMGILVENSHYNQILSNTCTTGSYDSGIRITGSNHNIISGNTLTGHFHSILLEYSNNNTVSRNTCVSGYYNCILLSSSSYNDVSNNTCRSSNRNEDDYSGNGIQLESGSTFNTVSYNTCYSNIRGGILVWGSSNNTISYNTCYSDRNGIYILSSSNCTVVANTCNGNTNGINVGYSPNTTITGNTCNGNTNDCGIRSLSSSNLIVTNNVCNNDYFGIMLVSSNGGIVSNNVCITGSDSGIRLESSFSNIIDNNTCNNFISHGICLAYSGCENNRVTNNTCTGNTNGIHLYSSDSNYIANNDLVGNKDRGIYVVVSSDHNHFENNTCTTTNSGSSGIFVESSTNETITNNLCYSTVYGIFLNAVTESTVANNTCYGSMIGIYAYSSGDNLVSNNTCTENTQNGISLFSSCSSNVISENNCSDNDGIGISLASNCNFNTIINNTCIGNVNTDYGIYVGSSFNNTISGNTCNGDIDCSYSIYLYYSDDNVVMNNTCPNGQDGIWVYYSSRNVVSGNLLCNNSIGVSIDTGFNNIVTNNTLVNNSVGVQIFSSNSNTISNNLFYDSNVTGVNLLSSSYLNVTGNTLINSTDGIRAEYCHHIDIDDNTLNENANGTYLFSCNNIEVFENRIMYCYGTEAGYGVYLLDSSDCDIWNNTCEYNMRDICLDSTSGSTVTGNVCEGSWISIFIRSEGSTISQNNLVSNNSCTSSFCGIALFTNLNSTVVGNSCSNHNFGINITESSGINVTGNQIIYVNMGICFYQTNDSAISSNLIGLCGEGVKIEESHRNIINENMIAMADYGISLYDSNDTVVYGNSVNSSSDNGIYLNNSENNSINANSIYGSDGYGIYLNASTGNLLFGNELTSNNGAGVVYNSSAVQAYDDGDNRWNSTYGNLWSDRTYPDADHDGLVDVSYALDGGAGNADLRPIANASIGITSPATLAYTNISNITIRGEAADACITSIVWYNDANDESGSCIGTTTWTGNVSLMEGTNNITVTMTDALGRVLSDNVTVVYSTGITFSLTPADGSTFYTNQNTLDIYVNVSDYAPIGFERLRIMNCSLSSFMGIIFYTNYDGIIATIGLSTEGNGYFECTFVDMAGNSVHGIFYFIYDVTAPSLAIDAPANGYVNSTGSVMVTWTASDTLSGIDHYAVSSDGTTWTNVTGTEHMFSLADGNYTLFVRAYDRAGNFNETNVTVSVDTTAPVVVVSSPANDSYHGNGVVPVNWTVSDAIAGVSSVLIRFDNGTWVNVTDVTSYTNGTLSEGIHTIYFNATDALGNYIVTSMVIIIDLTDPTVYITSPANGTSLNPGTVLLSWEAEDIIGIANCSISVNGGEWVLVNGTSYLFTDLAEGNYTVRVRAYDNVGNFNITAISFIIDRTDPSVTITVPSDGSYDADSNVTITWTGSDDRCGVDHYWVSVDGVITSLPANATSYTFRGASDGTHIISVRAFDKAGNNEWMVITVIVDTTAPSVVITAPGNGSYLNDPAVTVTWTASDVTSGISHTEISMDGTTWTSVSGSSYALSTLADGTYTVQLRATDAVGNIGYGQATFVVDTIAPVLEVTPADGAHSNDVDLVVFWNTTDASGILYCSVSTDGVNWAVVNGTSYALNDLDDGNYTIYVRAYDLAGNFNEGIVHLIIDTVSPTIVAHSPMGSGAAVSSAIIAVFSEDMDASTILVTISGVDGAISGRGTTYSFIPASDLEYNSDYTVTMSGKDLAGNTVSLTWAFSTIDAGDVEGDLVDAYGRGLANVTITLSNGMTATTDEEGHFLFEDVPTGTYEMTAERDGYDMLSMNITVTAEETLALDEVEMDKTLNGGGDIFIIVAIVIIVAMAGAAVVMMVPRRVK
ncbi:MAG: right-handed parallel beta-helix repeat-containing protein [Methanomassiliicoccales archaeon]|nr:right-handed parallel beta-helix repeat-containing protein [Methanomassiliicoccales archaeon]